MHHPRSLLLAMLALGLGADAARAGEPIAGPTRAVFRVQDDGFRVTPAASRRRRDGGNASGDMLTMRGTFECPGGYVQVYQGWIYAFEQKGVDVAQFGDVDPTCWPIQAQPPMETTFLGNWEKVAMCAVCARNPDEPLTGSPPFTSNPIPGGSTPGVPGSNTQQPNDDGDDDGPSGDDTSNVPIPGT